MQGVASTALWVAAVRAIESERADALFSDPFARALAGDEGFEAHHRAEDPMGGASTSLVVRTHFLDARIAQAVTVAGLRQVVVLAAGMDARAYRLAWPAGTRVYELDQAAVLEHKARALGDAVPRCERHAIAVDLRDDWPNALLAAGFVAAEPTLWLVEGLLLYLEAAQAAALFARVDALSARGSVALFDVMGRSLLESPYMTAMLAKMVAAGAPWRFGTDDPETLLGPHGWQSEVQDFSEVGTALGRWPYPRVDRRAPGVPHSYLVEAVKR